MGINACTENGVTNVTNYHCKKVAKTSKKKNLKKIVRSDQDNKTAVWKMLRTISGYIVRCKDMFLPVVELP